MVKGINRRFFLFLLVSILILSISISVTFTILKIHRKENSVFLTEINNGIEGYFFFEGKDIHLPYVYYNMYEGYYIGWTQVTNNLLEYKLNNNFHQNPEYKQISFFYSIKGIKSVDGYYYFFANGEDGFFDPGTVGQRSKDLMNWEPFPSFNNDTSSEILKTFIGTDADSQGTLHSCFSDIQGFVHYGFGNYSFYIVTISGNNWQMENITFEGDLESLGKGYFTIYENKPVIIWNFYNSSLDLINLNLSIKNNLDIWNNFTITYTNQDLLPIGFHETENELEVYFSGLSYYGENHPSNFNQTTLYCATYSDDTVLSETLFTYPERIYIKENCFHQWNNGSISLFFESSKDGFTKTFYGIISNEEVTLTEIVYNKSTTFRRAHQFEIVDDKIYLLWNEYFIHPTDYDKDYSKLYLGIIPLDFPLDFENEIIDYTVEWLKPSSISLSLKLAVREEHTNFRSYD